MVIESLQRKKFLRIPKTQNDHIMKETTSLFDKVQEALGNESKLKTCLTDIYIQVIDGAVILAGSVTHESLKTLACKIVSQIPGVNLFIEDLKVETEKTRRIGVNIDWTKGSMNLQS